MQGQKGILGLQESLNFERGSTSSNAVIDQQVRWNDVLDHADRGLNHGVHCEYLLSSPQVSMSPMYHEPNITGTKNEVNNHNEQTTDSSGGASASTYLRVEEPRSSGFNANPYPDASLIPTLHLNSGFIDHRDASGIMENHNLYIISDDSDNELGSSAGGSEYLVDPNVGQPGSSCHTSVKRKADGSSFEQSSSSRGHSGESNAWASSFAYYNAGRGLTMPGPSDQDGQCSSWMESAIQVPEESSSRNLRVRLNPSSQQEPLNPPVFAAGNVVRPSGGSSSQQSSGVLPSAQSLNLRPSPGLGLVRPQGQTSMLNAQAVPRNVQPIRWHLGSTSRTGGSSSSSGSPDDYAVLRDEARRSISRNLSENPLLMPATEMRSSAQSPIQRSFTGGHLSVTGNAATPTSVGSSSGLRPSPAQRASRYPQRFSTELIRRSLLHVHSDEFGSQGDNIQPSSGPPPSPEEMVQSSGADNQGQNQAYRTVPWSERQSDNGMIQHSLRALASASGGSGRLVASEIRNVLDLMRRGESVRLEDLMLLNQSVFRVADIHDRHRDMRLDVDNMSYEELLALEERIGDVCTGLSEDTISSRLKQWNFSAGTGKQEVEPCCVCQEEYKDGDDIGTLKCGHDFHGECIKQWLMRKNLCPICKTTGLNTSKLADN